MNDLTFAKATADEFRTFWEGQGWTVKPPYDSDVLEATKETNSGFGVAFQNRPAPFWGVRAFWGNEVSPKDPMPYATFGEALEILNELAATRAFGGWAVEEGSE